MRKYLFASLALALVFAGGVMALVRPMHCPVSRSAVGRIEWRTTRARVHANS